MEKVRCNWCDRPNPTLMTFPEGKRFCQQCIGERVAVMSALQREYKNEIVGDYIRRVKDPDFRWTVDEAADAVMGIFSTRTESDITENAKEAYFESVKGVIVALVDQDSPAERYANAIRKHRDEHGDDRCKDDDYELYRCLPEGYTPPPFDTTVELHNCARYIASRQDPSVHYVSPEREIERLRKALRRVNEMLTIPAAEYVPAIPDAWKVIETALAPPPKGEGLEQCPWEEIERLKKRVKEIEYRRNSEE